jgi:5'-AMP-activated protein kinase catalytic alpha subunit
METEFSEKLLKALSELNVRLIDKNEITKEKPEIGKGGYGKVYKGKYQEFDVAIKKLTNLKSANEKEIIAALTDIINEIKVMEVCKNDRFPMFYGVVNRKSIYLIFELIKGDTLTKLYKNMNKQEKLSAVEQLCQILEDLHSKKVLHRDIKPDNIMIEQGNRVRLIDFGLARISNNTITQTCNNKVSLPYIAPEVVKPTDSGIGNAKPIQISPKIDVWSCGCILSEIFSEIQPWANTCKNNIQITRSLIMGKEFPIPEKVDDDVKDLIKKATALDPVDRTTAKELKQYIASALKAL